MMGDAADDAWDAAFWGEVSRLTIIGALESKCQRKPCGADKFVTNDDGLFECEVCGKIVDL